MVVGKKLILLMFLGVLVATLGVGLVMAGPPGPTNPPDGHALVTICHEPGTPDQKTMDVPDSAVPGHLGHGDTLGPCSPPPTPTPIPPTPTPTPIPPTPTPTPMPPPTGCGAPGVIDICVDGDGIATAGPGAFIIQIGDVILSAGAGGNPSGLDLIDRGLINGLYEAGDDLMVEDPFGTPSCPTAQRDSIYNNVAGGAQDCVVLDPDGSLTDGDFVTCDTGAGCGLWFRDDNLNGRYDVGEDLVVDVNLNGIFD